MDLTTYRLIHLLGLVLMLVGLGGSLVAGKSGNGKAIVMAFHGLGLLAVLVAGFGMLAKSDLGFPGWIAAKLGLWLLIGALPFVVKKGYLTPTIGLVLGAAFAGGAIWLAIARPF